jgi:hypothetical protein
MNKCKNLQKKQNIGVHLLTEVNSTIHYSLFTFILVRVDLAKYSFLKMLPIYF